MQNAMDDADVRDLVRAEATDAIDYIEEWVAPQRALALRYYRGDKLGNEEEGRSTVVSRDVRDAVQSVLPSLMRVFFSNERVVEYRPVGPEDTEAAEQATDYVNHLIVERNNGVETFYTVFKDSLISKAGIVKWWRDESLEVTYHKFSGLDDAGVGVVTSEPGVELHTVESYPAPITGPVNPELPLPQLHDVTVKRVRRSPRLRIGAVPGEEFLIDRKARSIEDARYVGHRQYLSVNELVALGYDRDFVEGNVASESSFNTDTDVYERFKNLGGYMDDDTSNDAERPVLYVEHYLRIDVDGDGLAEMRKVCTMGDGYEVVSNEPCNERPFAAFCPDPEPHLFWGSDLADLTMDLQLINTNIKRTILDSGAQAIYPRTAYVEGEVNLDDLLNTEMGAVIGMTKPGMVSPFIMPFVGKELLPVLEMLEREKDRRVGTHDIALDADALQSTTAVAVNAQVDSAKQRLEMIARLYAEGPMKRIYKGLLRLVQQHQDKPEMVRLRNEWVEIDPRGWNADMDVTVSVGLGKGMAEDRRMALSQALAFQKEVLQQMGPNNPVVTLGQLTNTFAKLMENSGWKDSNQFANRLPLDFQPPPPEPKPDPAEILAQVEREKTMADMRNDLAKLALERDKWIAEVYFRAKELELEEETAQAEIAAMRERDAA